MKKCTFILTALSILLTFSAEAQIWKNAEKKIGKKIEQKASQRAERKVDKAIDKTLDEVEEAPKKKGDQSSDSDNKPTSQPTVNIPGVNKSNVALPEKYTFKIGITYEVKDDASKSKHNEMTTWYGDEILIGVEAEKSSFLIMDIKRNALVTFMEASKMYMTISNDFSGAIPADETNDTNPDFKIEKIGTEKILGYNCTIYKITTEEGVSKVWYTNDLKVGYNNYMAAMYQSKKKPKQMPAITEGVMLKMENTEKGSKKTSTMIATTVNKNGKTLVVSDYKPM